MDLTNWSLKRVLAVVGGLLGICALGCATIIEGNKEEMSVASEPDGAIVSVNGDKKGKTPAKFTLPKDDSHTIKIEKDGYESETINVSNEIDVKWVVIDVVLGVVPIVVDAVTGAWYRLDQTDIAVELEETKSAGGVPYELEIEGATQIAGPMDPLSRTGPVPHRPAVE